MRALGGRARAYSHVRESKHRVELHNPVQSHHARGAREWLDASAIQRKIGSSSVADTHMSKFEAIFFDMDGLLVNTEPLDFKGTKEVFASVNVNLTREWYIHEHLGKGRSVSELLRENGIAEERIAELREVRHKQYWEYLEAEAAAIDGVPETLRKLHGRLLLAIVTGSNRKSIDIVMRKTGLRDFFDFVVTYEDTEHHKPYPDPYLKALSLSQKPTEKCLVLEDSGNGTQAAKAAGLTCFAIPDEMTKGHDFSIADKVLGSIRELPGLLL